jgi:L-rhamnose-H+ transport protein
LGTVTALAGIGFCGYAGMLRERGERIGPVVPRQMVGFSRPFGVGFLICVASGIASAFINVGYTLSEGIVTKVVQMGNRPFAGSNAIWLFMLGGGAITNLAYCGYLLGKNRTWSNFQHPKSTHLYMLAILMGLLWEGSILAYGSAAPKLGKLGPAIGWPLNLAVSLITANLWGFFTGEWKFSSTRSRRGMIVGLVILLGAIGILGWSSQLTG